MKRIYNYITLAITALVCLGCIESVTPDVPSAESGDEVQFGLSLSGPKTKTTYGLEANNAFPLYWVNGDKVAVYSPECLAGRNSAEYQVSVPEDEAQNYADELTKTGEVGVQWGSSETAVFYSIYPSENATISGEGENVTASLNIPATQLLTHTLTNNTYYASDMNSVIMYAKKEASKSDEAVYLQYTPYSTVIEFELTGDFTQNASASLFIESLTLTSAAPKTEGATAPYLAGDFDFKFSETPVVSATGNNRSSVTLQFATQPELDNTNKVLKAKMSLMPIGVESLDNWTVSVNLREGDNTSKTLVKTLKTKANESTALNAGEVHKIKLPALTATKEWTYTPEAWMPQIPEYEKVYLTELSIPGAWYAGAPVDHGYQATQSISDLWNNGIRAFAVETKTAVDYQELIFGATAVKGPNPIDVVVSGTGDNQSLGQTSAGGTNTLNGTTSGANGPAYKANGISITTIFTNIIDCLIQQQSKPEQQLEFAVLVLSYADGGSSGKRFVDYGAWLSLISDAYKNLPSTYQNYVYKQEISSSTTIADVLGKLVIKINVDKNIALGGAVTDNGTKYSYLYDCETLPALLSYNPLMYQLTSNEYASPLFSNLHWKTWSDTETHRAYSTSYNSSNFMWCFSSANRTHIDGNGTYDIPTYAQRKSALSSMMTHSKQIHDNSTHNIWFYFNVGGTETSNSTIDTNEDNAKTFASKMNPWLLEIIQHKINGYAANGVFYPSDPSPLGIVMFNQCTSDTYKGPEIIRAIIEMNNKFPLKREGGIENANVSVDNWETELL